MPVSDTILPLGRSSTLKRVAGWSLLIGLYAALPVIKEFSVYSQFGDAPSIVHAALTLVLGWLLVFRTNSAYQRWWEARTLWGSLVNTCRNLAVKVSSIPTLAPEQRTQMQREIVAFPYALRDHLRDDRQAENIGREATSSAWSHLPNSVVSRIYRQFWEWKSAGQIGGQELRVLDVQGHQFLDICGGCERIRSTPIAVSYRYFARQCIFLFLLTFPWGVANEFREWTIPLTVIVAYFMLGLETVAEHVEEPFGRDEDDLDLDGLCKTIETTVDEVFARMAND